MSVMRDASNAAFRSVVRRFHYRDLAFDMSDDTKRAQWLWHFRSIEWSELTPRLCPIAEYVCNRHRQRRSVSDSQRTLTQAIRMLR